MTTTEEEKKNPIQESDTIFDAAIIESEKHTNDAISAIDSYEQTQKDLLQEQTDYLVQKGEQQKAQAAQDYTNEQSAAYADYQKEVDPYGVQAEQVAASGLSNSGYAESLKTQAYVAYQNRVAVARQAYQQAVVDFDKAMTEARMQNNVQMAQIAFQSLQARLEAALTGFQYKNSLVMEKANTRYKIAQENPEAWVEVLEQIYAADNGKIANNEEYANAPTFSYTVPATSSSGSISREKWELAKKQGAKGLGYNFSTYEEYLEWAKQYQ